MGENSEIISGFLDWLRNIPQLYDANLADQKQQEDLTQDLLHHLELDNPNYREIARAGQRLIEARRRRRQAKDAAEELKPIVEYIEGNKAAIKALERLLGEVRKAEQRHKNRIYTPRVKE